MIVKRSRINAKGKQEMVVEVEPGTKLIEISAHGHYRLGGQVDDVYESHVLQDARPVHWCHFEQSWVDVR